jgi:membrane protease YdiL (CAAX protease family)
MILFVGGALGEEIGWRGYALDKLIASHGILVGTLILGLIWSFWHLPLFFIEGTVQSNLPIWQFMLQNTILAFFYTKLYLRTKNISLMILLHAFMNTASAVFPYWTSDVGRYLGLVLLVIYLFSFDRILDLIEKKTP